MKFNFWNVNFNFAQIKLHYAQINWNFANVFFKFVDNKKINFKDIKYIFYLLYVLDKRHLYTKRY